MSVLPKRLSGTPLLVSIPVSDAKLHRFGADTLSGKLSRGLAARLNDLEEIKKAAVEAWSKSKPTVLEIPISRQIPSLI